ncbi:MAG: gliding motility-associated C-terminal domain-containing protein [Chitinophagaceae bacterium]|jgi:gliding motility-associated-like protein
MIRFFLVIIILSLTSLGYCQLPGNFNLIGDAQLKLISGSTGIYDTTFIGNCWVKAGRQGTDISSFFYAYRDTTKKDMVIEALLNDYAFDMVQPVIWKYKISTKTILDSIGGVSSDLRSYVQNRLYEPLIAGKTYTFTIHNVIWSQSIASFLESSTSIFQTAPIRNLGVLFSDTQIQQFTNRGRIDLKPQINFRDWSNTKIDTFEFIKLTAQYTAMGGEQYITIGNFDYFSDFKIRLSPAEIYSFGGDSLAIGGYPDLYFNPSLVSDTTLPIISLTQFSLGNDTTLACMGDSIRLGGEDHFFHYWWNTGDTSRFITIKTPGTYWCRVDFGCSTYTDTIVVKPLDFSFSLGKDTSINCTGSTIRLKAPTGYSYVWSTGSTTSHLDITSPGKYWCLLDYGCGTYTDTILVKANPFTFSLGADTRIKCFADSIRVFASAAYSNLWSTGETSNSILVTTPGTYWCRADDGCTTFTDTIIINPILESFSLGMDTTICADIPLLLNAPSGKTILWNTGASTNAIVITTPGTYWCRIDFGCNTVTDTIVVSGSVAPAPFNIEDTALCEAQLPVSISAPYTAAAYLWSNGSTDFTTSFSTIGQQWLRISNLCGDKHYTDTFEIKSLNVALNNINLGKDTNNCLYGFFLDTITLQVPANNSTQIKWSTGSTNPSISVNQPGTYWVKVSNICYSVSDTINISGCSVRDVPKVDIPNAFSPNGDGKNDVFRLKYLPQQVVSFHLKIYNRYGQMVSELKSRTDEWDGGNYELGVYYYLFVYKDITGKEYTQKGDISLVR